MSDLLSRFKRLQLARHAYLHQWTPARNILPQHSLLWASYDVQPPPPRASPEDADLEAPYPLHSQWLLAIPNPRLGQKMEPLEFRAALAFRMFVPLCPPKTSCGNTCVQEVDIFGYHALSCLGKGNLLKQRHEVVLHALYRLTCAAGMGAQMNAKVTCLGPSVSGITQFRPADLLLSSRKGQECVDLTITSPLSQPKTGSIAGRVPGHLAMSSASAKRKKYDESCEAVGKTFTPFSVDVCGLADPAASHLLQRIASRMASSSDGSSYAKCIELCRRRISLAVQLAVAQQLTYLLLPTRKGPFSNLCV